MTHVTKEIGLSEVIIKSQWICSAEYLGPDKEISAGHRFRTIKTLMNRMKSEKAPKEFIVVTPWAVANAMVQKAQKATGVRRFPLIYRMTEGTEFPGKKGEQLILFLDEKDDKVLVLVAENASLPTSKQDSVVKMISESGKGPHDLVFLGKVESIEISPLPKSPYNFVVKTKVLKIVKGKFDGSHFSFRIHSPSKSRIEVGQELEVKAKRVKDGFQVDPNQFFNR